MKRWLLILLPAILLTPGSANSQSAKDGPLAKLTANLVALHEQYSSHLPYGTAAVFSSDDPLVIMVDDRVVVDAVASGNADVLKSDLVSLGMQNAVAFGRIVSGELPIAAIPAAAALTSLNFVRPAAAMTNTGKVTSQGDHAIRADAARTMFGLDGSGVTVGVLSDSFNCLGGAAGDVASGDLSTVNVISEISSCTGATDEGRAMLQIVHDVAPGASLSFASAFNGQASFAANIQALKAAGAKVIVDDVIYLAEPFFQDGIIAQAAANVVAGGSAYFSAAGNDDRQSYESAFRPGDSFADGAIPSGPSAPHFFGGIAHNFNSSGGKDQFQSITIPGRATVTFILQWDSPFFSVSGAPGTPNDVDMYILNSSATQILAGSAFNNIGGDAVEIFSFTNNSMTPVSVNIMIVKFSGANPGLIKYIRMGPATLNEYDTQSGTIFGHANAAAAEAVGAVAYFNTPAFGVSRPVLESYSSSGTTPILFDLLGNRLAAPDPRADKPEISAPDGVNTTFFGTDTDGDGFPNFFGTSAAAPHAAAVAALLLQGHPTSTPAGIYNALERTAIDMGTAGVDNDSGFGLIQADTAVAAASVIAGNYVEGQVQYTDVNGDGKADLIFQGLDNNFWVSLSTGTDLTLPTLLVVHGGTFVNGQAQYADLNGDGKADLIFQGGDNKFWVSLSTGSGFTSPALWMVHGGTFVKGQAQYADLNGDGKADLIFQGLDNNFWVSLSTGTGFTSPALWVVHGGSFVNGQAQYADLNGDGKADLIFQGSDNKFWVSLSTGSGFTSPALWMFHGGTFVKGEAQYADLNGDGKADLIFQGLDNNFWVSLSTGTGFTLPALWVVHGGSFVEGEAQYTDLNGDGKADLIFEGLDNSFWVSFSTGSGFSGPQFWY
jgi:subtilisin family serine protease